MMLNIVSWQGHLDTAVTDEAGYGDLELEREASVGSPYWCAVTAAVAAGVGEGRRAAGHQHGLPQQPGPGRPHRLPPARDLRPRQ